MWGCLESVLLDVCAEGVDDVVGVGRSAGLGVETVETVEVDCL